MALREIISFKSYHSFQIGIRLMTISQPRLKAFDKFAHIFEKQLAKRTAKGQIIVLPDYNGRIIEDPVDNKKLSDGLHKVLSHYDEDLQNLQEINIKEGVSKQRRRRMSRPNQQIPTFELLQKSPKKLKRQHLQAKRITSSVNPRYPLVNRGKIEKSI